VRHLALRDRIGQPRGVSIFASVLTRLSDLKDYEESERVAAKVAASMSAFIRRGTPDMYGSSEYETSGEQKSRPQHFVPGMVMELDPGEDIGMIDTSRPNAGLEPFRDGQLRATAAGLRMSFSSLAKKYDGTYSAQRQELVEQWSAYALLSAEFTHQMVRPVYRRFITAAQLSGQLIVPRDADKTKLADALFVPQAMPWIDPLKEAMAWERQEQAGHISGPDVIRRRGLNPAAVRNAEIAWRESWRAKGERITADPSAADPASFAAALALDQTPDGNST
jgi:lambda family phage portal protein